MKGEASPTQRDLERRINARQAAERTLLLEVTLLGDGSGTQEYSKRLELRERLESHRFVSRVTIPEILHERNPLATVGEVERSAIERADVVLCLEGPQRPALGLHTEMTKYFDRTTPDKWFYGRPTDQAEKPSTEPLVTQLARDEIKRIVTFDYDPKEWAECGRITAAFEGRIELMAHREGDRRASRFG